MGTSDSTILDDPRGLSKSVVMLGTVWKSSCPSRLCAGHLVLSSWKVCCSLSAYSDSECLLSPRLKCILRKVFGLGGPDSLCHLQLAPSYVQAQSVSCSAVIVVGFKAMASEKLFPPH